MLEEGGGRKNFSVRDMVEELVTAIYAQWEKSNVKFKPPVVADRKPLVNKLRKAWERMTDIALKKETKAHVVSYWESRLDKLFDITLCQCPITLCEDSDQPPCEEDCIKQAHINCSCEAAQKVPVLELAWLKGQKEKTGSKFKYQMKNADLKETEKQINTAKRKLADSDSLANQQKKAQTEKERIFGKVKFLFGLVQVQNLSLNQ